MKKKVTAKQFCKVFHKLWNEEKENKREVILGAYLDSDKDLWTKYMLGNNDSFLHRVSKGLVSGEQSFEMAREWMKMDCVYYKKKPNLIENNIYPACFDVYIEHENWNKVEEEMWKLLLYRSPLKVLIFYDYPEYDKNTETKENWLQNKLAKLLWMGQKVDDEWPEADNTEYLFLVGNRVNEGGFPRWRYLIVESGYFRKVSEQGSHELTLKELDEPE